jgi:hypothetical protein
LDGLSKEEIEILQKNGFMDKKAIFLVPDEFWFKGLVLPSYWLKCLLAFEGLLNISEQNKEKEEVEKNE